ITISVAAAASLTASPDGTTVPTTATQIVDSNGAIWTIGASYAILRNGTSAAGGIGTKILWKSSTIYVFGTDSNWWQWTGSGWINIGSSNPGGAPSSPHGHTGDTYEVIKTYPHDTSAFTEGLELAGGALYESTGLYGSS